MQTLQILSWVNYQMMMVKEQLQRNLIIFISIAWDLVWDAVACRYFVLCNLSILTSWRLFNFLPVELFFHIALTESLWNFCAATVNPSHTEMFGTHTLYYGGVDPTPLPWSQEP